MVSPVDKGSQVDASSCCRCRPCFRGIGFQDWWCAGTPSPGPWGGDRVGALEKKEESEGPLCKRGQSPWAEPGAPAPTLPVASSPRKPAHCSLLLLVLGREASCLPGHQKKKMHHGKSERVEKIKYTNEGCSPSPCSASPRGAPAPAETGRHTDKSASQTREP